MPGLARGEPRAPSPRQTTADQRFTGLRLAPPTDPPTSESASSIFERGVRHRFGFPCHGKLAGRTAHGVGSPRPPGFDGFC